MPGNCPGRTMIETTQFVRSAAHIRLAPANFWKKAAAYALGKKASRTLIICTISALTGRAFDAEDHRRRRASVPKQRSTGFSICGGWNDYSGFLRSAHRLWHGVFQRDGWRFLWSSRYRGPFVRNCRRHAQSPERPMTQHDRAAPLTRWLVALVTAGLSPDEALAIVSSVQREQLQSERKAA